MGLDANRFTFEGHLLTPPHPILLLKRKYPTPPHRDKHLPVRFRCGLSPPPVRLWSKLAAPVLAGHLQRIFPAFAGAIISGTPLLAGHSLEHFLAFAGAFFREPPYWLGIPLNMFLDPRCPSAMFS